MKAVLFAATLAASQVIAWSASADSIIIPPVQLLQGATVSLLPNGYSTADAYSRTRLYDNSQAYTFDDGLSIELRARVIRYDDSPSYVHPGLYFDYEINVLAGRVESFSVDGWSDLRTYVKICGIGGCGGSGADGVAPTSVSRSTDGNELTWDFSDLVAGQHSANLQVFSPVADFVDPPAFFTDGSGNTFAIETVAPLVSAIPLPASAPMFGAALLALAGFGYGLKRRKENAAAGTR